MQTAGRVGVAGETDIGASRVIGRVRMSERFKCEATNRREAAVTERTARWCVPLAAQPNRGFRSSREISEVFVSLTEKAVVDQWQIF